MTLYVLRDKPGEALGRALAEFEARFTYPLGSGRHFTISHGDDYPRFFRAIGDARCFINEKSGRVTGALGVAIRPLTLPDGSELPAAYVGDLKVDPGVRGSLAFLRLAQAADQWARPHVRAAYGIVMDGTRASPAEYSGRAGIELFSKLGKVFVLRFPCAKGDVRPANISEADGSHVFRSLTQARYVPAGGNPQERSEIAPRWLVDRDGLACGRLEDTRRAKRLTDGRGIEMASAHLSNFAFRTPEAAMNLIERARQIALHMGFSSVFTAVAEQDFPLLETALSKETVVAPATIYGAGLRPGPAWAINSSEI